MPGETITSLPPSPFSFLMVFKPRSLPEVISPGRTVSSLGCTVPRAELCLEYTEHLMLLINVIISYYIYLDLQEGVHLCKTCCRGWMLLCPCYLSHLALVMWCTADKSRMLEY